MNHGIDNQTDTSFQ